MSALLSMARLRVTANRTLAGCALRMPAVDADSIGAGGGSSHDLGWIPAVGRSGERGSDPGLHAMAAVDRFRPSATLNMLLGYLEDGAVFADLTLSADAAKSALAPLSKQLHQG